MLIQIIPYFEYRYKVRCFKLLYEFKQSYLANNIITILENSFHVLLIDNTVEIKSYQPKQEHDYTITLPRKINSHTSNIYL